MQKLALFIFYTCFVKINFYFGHNQLNSDLVSKQRHCQNRPFAIGKSSLSVIFELPRGCLKPDLSCGDRIITRLGERVSAIDWPSNLHI